MEWGPTHSACGWPCENGDVLRHIAAWIQFRKAPLELRHVRAHSGNGHGDAADALAKCGAKKPLISASELYLPDQVQLSSPSLQELALDKVMSSLCPMAARLFKAEGSFEMRLLCCRGRAYFRAMQTRALQDLVDASANSGLFWRQYRALADPKPVTPLVSLDGLTAVFQRRMNPPPDLPESFNYFRFIANTVELAHLPDVSTDTSVDGYFSSGWREEDIEWAKAHVKEHSISSSRGMDGVDYATILEIENDKLCSLFNTCLDLCDAPSVWSTMLIVGIS